jgi:hypothetical protein
MIRARRRYPRAPRHQCGVGCRLASTSVMARVAPLQVVRAYGDDRLPQNLGTGAVVFAIRRSARGSGTPLAACGPHTSRPDRRPREVVGSEHTTDTKGTTTAIPPGELWDQLEIGAGRQVDPNEHSRDRMQDAQHELEEPLRSSSPSSRSCRLCRPAIPAPCGSHLSSSPRRATCKASSA